MAKILTQGKTPLWGVKEHQLDGVIIDSYNESLEIKDYEQTDEKGAVCGYLIYDQTKSFDMSGTLLKPIETPLNGDFQIGKCVSGLIHSLTFCTLGMNCSINTPTVPILKSLSFSQSAGGAQTFNASGTFYDFGC
jgi:hypothetical protein